MDQSQELICEPKVQEIRNALFSIRDQKALGLDGFGSKFFKHVWDTVKSDFIDAVLKFFKSGKLLKQWNHTLISLMPKSSSATKVEDYSLISYCNMFYKVISKILATRIATVAEHLLHPTQIAFIKGRIISDNVHLAQKLLRSNSRKRISSKCILKVIFEGV